MTVATYNERPEFLRKELEKILRERGRQGNALKVGRTVPNVRVTPEGSVRVVTPSVPKTTRR